MGPEFEERSLVAERNCKCFGYFRKDLVLLRGRWWPSRVSDQATAKWWLWVVLAVGVSWLIGGVIVARGKGFILAFPFVNKGALFLNFFFYFILNLHSFGFHDLSPKALFLCLVLVKVVVEAYHCANPTINPCLRVTFKRVNYLKTQLFY